MNMKINLFLVNSLIEELSYLRFNLLNREEYHEDFLLVARVSSSIFVATRLDKEDFDKLIKKIFTGTTGAVGEYMTLDLSDSINDESYLFDTSDNEILKLKRVFSDIKTANKNIEMITKIDDEDDYHRPNKIPSLDDLLDKICNNGIDSLTKEEKELLSEYSK
jgi:hypothetical protein